MSIQALNWAFGQSLPMSEKFTLVVLANYADEQHSCFPSQARIASDMGAAEVTVRRNVKSLEEGGYVVRSKRVDPSGHRTSDRYRLAVGRQIPTDQKAHRSKSPVGFESIPTDQSDRSLPITESIPTDHSDRVSTNEPPVEPPENPQLGRASATTTRGTRLPDGWTPSAEVIEQMRGECPGVDLQAEHRRFTDYWDAVPGARGRKVRWDATWRNWIRRAHEDVRRAPQSADQRRAEALARVSQHTAWEPPTGTSAWTTSGGLELER